MSDEQDPLERIGDGISLAGVWKENLRRYIPKGRCVQDSCRMVVLCCLSLTRAHSNVCGSAAAFSLAHKRLSPREIAA